MPPPPPELSVMPSPSMLDGLHQKLLGYGLGTAGASPPPPPPPVALPQSAVVRSVVPIGKPPSVICPTPNGSDPAGYFTPFDNTVIPAPSSAPMRLGSCNSSAMLPF